MDEEYLKQFIGKTIDSISIGEQSYLTEGPSIKFTDGSLFEICGAYGYGLLYEN